MLGREYQGKVPSRRMAPHAVYQIIKHPIRYHVHERTCCGILPIGPGTPSLKKKVFYEIVWYKTSNKTRHLPIQKAKTNERTHIKQIPPIAKSNKMTKPNNPKNKKHKKHNASNNVLFVFIVFFGCEIKKECVAFSKVVFLKSQPSAKPSL